MNFSRTKKILWYIFYATGGIFLVLLFSVFILSLPIIFYSSGNITENKDLIGLLGYLWIMCKLYALTLIPAFVLLMLDILYLLINRKSYRNWILTKETAYQNPMASFAISKDLQYFYIEPWYKFKPVIIRTNLMTSFKHEYIKQNIFFNKFFYGNLKVHIYLSDGNTIKTTVPKEGNPSWITQNKSEKELLHTLINIEVNNEQTKPT